MTEPGEPSATPTQTATPAQTGGGAPAAPTTRDKVLLAVFWTWDALLALATLAQLFQWQGVLDALNVKHWFAR